jgi:branched-chain amino acid aminotransferase
VAIDELEKGIRNGSVTEAFGVGTGAVVAPIQTIHIKGADYHLPPYSHDNLMYQIKQKLERIRTGKDDDVYGWNNVV